MTDYRKKAEEESKKHEDLKQKHEVDEREKKSLEGTTESQVEESNGSSPNMCVVFSTKKKKKIRKIIRKNVSLIMDDSLLFLNQLCPEDQ